MHYETPGGNVIRFPVELRVTPSIDLLFDIAPDSREVDLIAEAFGFDWPDPEGRREALNAMLKPIVERAVAACAEARQAALCSDEAGETLARAQIEGGY